MSAYPPPYPQTLCALLPPPGPAPLVTDEAGTLDRTAFHEGVARTAGALRAAGVAQGGRVALWLPNGAPYLLAIFACARLGALAIHINTRFRSLEAGSLLRRSRASVLVTQWGFGPVDFPAILAALPGEDLLSLRHVLAVGAAPTTAAGLPVAPLKGVPDAGPDLGTAQAPCLTFTTSGTTSGPKLVLHDQGAIAGHAADVARRFGFEPGAVLLGAVPFCGTFGNAAAMAAVFGGAHIVAMPQFDGEAAAALIRQHGITHCVGGDDMYGRIAATGGRFETMRLGGFGAFHSTAAGSIALADAAGMQPAGVYGSSEVQALFSVSEGRNRLLGGGVPVGQGVQLSVRDPGTGAPVPPGASGELWVRAPSLFRGYLENDAATARAFDSAGFFRTGDMARLDREGGGGFVYEARLGDALRLGGFLVSPEEIEGFLQSQPGVAAVQVVGAGTGGDLVPVAFVQPAPGAALDTAALHAACRGKLARFKVPARIVLLDAFPVVQSANGPKVQRNRLREMADTLLQAEETA